MRESAMRRLASVAAPPGCGACGLACPAGAVICGGCERALRDSRALVSAGPREVDLAIAAGEYSGRLRAVAHGLKFGRRLSLARPAAEAMIRACPPAELRGVLVPVPAAPWRRRWRGFDPAEELALALAALTGLPFRDCLRRCSGPRQVGRSRADRVADPPRVRLSGEAPAEALLVDDVHTTGATLGACAAALRAGGCARVVALTLARSR